MSKLLIPFFLFLPIAGLVWTFSSWAASPSTWTENWTSYDAVLARWEGIGDAGSGFSPRCFTVGTSLLDMKCQSGALKTIQKWDRTKTITAEASVHCNPNVGKNYWCGLTIIGADDPICDYAELATSFWESNEGNRWDFITSLTDCQSKTVAQFDDEGKWHKFKVNASPYGLVRYYVDGKLVSSQPFKLDHDPSIEVLCVSVAPGTPDDGTSAHCEFGPVTVTGVLIGSPTPTPTITPTPGPTGTPSPSPTTTPTPTPTPSVTPPLWFCQRFPQFCQ